MTMAFTIRTHHHFAIVLSGAILVFTFIALERYGGFLKRTSTSKEIVILREKTTNNLPKPLLTRRSEDRPPNIVFMLADDYGYNDIGYRNPVIRTPNLDALAAEGIKLENYYVQPICTPSRAQLMSGRYQIHTGLQHGIIWPAQPNCLPLDDPTLADKLTEAGYDSHMVGKWHLGLYKRACWPTNRGFKSFLGYLTGGEDYITHECIYGGPYKIAKDWHGLDFRDGLESVPHYRGMYSTHIYARRVQNIIEQHDKQKPLFLYVSFQAVHGPMEVPDSYREPYKFIKDENRQIYAGMTTCMDEAVGNITDTLKKEGLWDNTVLIFSTDNGGEVTKGGNNWPLRGGKGSLWEGGTHGVGFVSSPLLPDEVQGTINRELIHISDWFPTLVEGVAGWKLNGTKLDGYNVWDTIRKGVPSPRVELLHNINPRGLLPSFCNFTGSQKFKVSVRAAIRYYDWKLITGNPDNGKGHWVPPPESQKKTVKSVIPPGKCVWLFNIKDDPTENHDLSEEQGDMVDFLLERLQFYQDGAVEVRYPDPDPRANPTLHNDTWDSWE